MDSLCCAFYQSHPICCLMCAVGKYVEFRSTVLGLLLELSNQRLVHYGHSIYFCRGGLKLKSDFQKKFEGEVEAGFQNLELEACGNHSSCLLFSYLLQASRVMNLI